MDLILEYVSFGGTKVGEHLTSHQRNYANVDEFPQLRPFSRVFSVVAAEFYKLRTAWLAIVSLVLDDYPLVYHLRHLVGESMACSHYQYFQPYLQKRSRLSINKGRSKLRSVVATIEKVILA